ncbi:HAMP domain-containing sensor histidine kinase [Marinilactibacillus sp. XAAS-LB27]|uniref:sensor histidine kinase n=1 Tax=Marinilactibacillus sp. XAAS-LB27 TaxID=3114538 RepID=UPI002E198E9E|nr:HAMP domain-containing sensor histidine kinase [Marinilactibacillus sp. XAAS-LB27]
MFRNKGISKMLLSMMGVALIGVLIIALINPLSGIVALLSMSGLIGVSLYFDRQRYKEIESLSGYLRTISNGQYSLDVRDNQEGELSILKNEIYKVTLMLSKQSDYLNQDKKRLADALSDISHQLKTPLTSMLVMIDLLSQQNLTEEKRIEFTGNIEKQLERMDWLLSSLLKLSKIDAGIAIFKKETIVVEDLVLQSLEPLRIPIELKNQDLLITGENSVTFIGDQAWTSEALINILKNCVEHTPAEGRISIHYKENPLYTEILIEDTGKGISREDLPNIFKRFYRGKNASKNSIGIGLAMAHTVIESQQGSLDVKSELGKGTQFSIKFHKR